MNQLPSRLEVWGGVECTVNRVGDTFFDQLALSGHYERITADLESFSELGFSALRTALHWERVEKPDVWAIWDTLLEETTRLGMRPIVGFLHHGSGPPDTNLLDPAFPEKLADFALRVARRYPWVSDYTPVNEPQTTGRFACLYGHWYPHHRDMQSYLRALLNQIKGIVLSMSAIRTVQPLARLVHTEDGGQTFATSELEPFRLAREHRRWLGMDLLCGRVTRDHALFGFLRQHGLSEQEVLWFSEHPCPPSIIGLNYYVTSDRFLDHRLELYPPRAGGDTGDEPLVDIEAVRVARAGIGGVGPILRQAWQRYGIPVAITEAHLGCEPVEQTRWLAEIWQDAIEALADGVDVRAVTVWSLLGAYNWCNLCTKNDEIYEPGVFDVAAGEPQRTDLVEVCYRMARNQPLPSDAKNPGWWRRPDRFTIPPS